MTSVVVECVDVSAEVAFFVDALDARISLVRPADDPRLIVLEADGVSLEVRRAAVDRPVVVCVSASEASPELTSPGGSTVEFVVRTDEIPESEPTFAVVPGGGADAFGVGRAGMGYRDLLPDRWGGRFIVSHIRIDEEGDVADWVHFHRIRFQMIFVAAGWVDVVYEGQGEPFRMHAGDCVLQPPEIRHRVLRSSAGLEVIEIGCPAEHDTIADHELSLPTSTRRPDRDFGGQRFVRHIAADAAIEPWLDGSLAARDTGIGEATNGLAGAMVVSASAGSTTQAVTYSAEFCSIVGLAGNAVLEVEGRDPVRVSPRTSVTVPPGERWRWVDVSADHEALVVTLPADTIEPA